MPIGPAPAPAPPAPPARSNLPGSGPAPLAFGLTEANPNLIWSPRARARVSQTIALWRQRVEALHPAYLRIDVDWAAVQPRPGTPPRWGIRQSGCQRGSPPCLAFGGIAEELAAIASQQRSSGGFVPVINISGVPAWAARRPAGCEQPGTQPSSRPIAASALPAYRALIASLLALGHREGVALPYWSPWDEPNHPLFISPQRARCSRTSPSRSPGIYSTLVRSMGAELHSAGGQHQLVLGELAAASHGGGPHSTGIAEFVRGLPVDVICSSDLWSMHQYAGARSDYVSELERALDSRGACGRRARIWVTETGEGSPRTGPRRSVGTAQERAGCHALAGELGRFSGDPRIQAAFQYTFREDSVFPVGLANERLSRLYPSYYLWLALSRQRSRSSALPATACD